MTDDFHYSGPNKDKDDKNNNNGKRDSLIFLLPTGN